MEFSWVRMTRVTDFMKTRMGLVDGYVTMVSQKLQRLIQVGMDGYMVHLG
jgi:hypothetical protein